MKYKYLEAWVREVNDFSNRVKATTYFEDQIFINFMKTNIKLQLNLASEDTFCFFTKSDKLNSKGKLENFDEYLRNAKLSGINIIEGERIIVFKFQKITMYNELKHYQLYVELIPHYQNIILTDEDKKIIDAKKKISFAENRHRQILPGLKYELPPSNYKNKKETINFPLKLIDGKLVEGKNKDFTNINAIFEEKYYNFILRKRNEKIINHKIKKINKEIKKKQRKIPKLEREYSDEKKKKKWKERAELLKGNFDKIKPGMQEIKVKNYYEEGFPVITIPLDEKKNARQNIQYYFKKYRKARDGKKKIKEQINITQQEIAKLKQQREKLAANTQTVIEAEPSKSKQQKKKKKSFKSIRLGNSWEIFVGRNSKENDEITVRMAQPHDWWFHTRIYKGTHVVCRNYKKQELPHKLKFICCRLAAYHSKAKKSSNVPVDYTQIRYVRKPSGSPPGYVIYDHQKTLFIDPISFRAAVKMLKKWTND